MTALPERSENGEVRVRGAIPADAEAVRAIAEETWWATYGGIVEPEAIRQHLAAYYALDMLRRRIAGREAEWLIGELAGLCVGYCSVLAAGLEAELVTLYVLPESQRRGIGWALLERAVEVVRERGATAVRVGYALANRRAARFYGSAGFRSVGRHRRGGHGVVVVTARLVL